jgi:hypothetical protein
MLVKVFGFYPLVIANLVINSGIDLCPIKVLVGQAGGLCGGKTSKGFPDGETAQRARSRILP